MLRQNQAFISVPVLIGIITVLIVGGGVFAWQYFGMPEGEIEAPEEITQDETADWQTYRNEEYWFEMKYPADKLTEASFTCYHPGGKVDEKATKFSNDEMYVYFCRFEGNYENLAKDFGANIPVIINDHNGLKIKTEIRGGGRAWYFLETDKESTFMIDTFWAYNENQSFEEKEQIFNQMLSTFKFLETEATKKEVEPYIRVISPNGGGEWEAGKSYPVKVFCSEGVEGYTTVALLDKRGGTFESCLDGSELDSCIIGAFYCEADQTIEFNWTIPQYIKSGENVFKIEASTGMTPRYMDRSDDYFSIVSPAASITVLSLNGGEKSYEGNNGVAIVWKQNGLSGKEITIYLIGYDFLENPISVRSQYQISGGTGKEYLIQKVLANTKGLVMALAPDEYGIDWDIPLDFNQRFESTPVKYKLGVWDQSTGVADKSDDYFTIISPAIVCTDSDGGLNYNIKGTLIEGEKSRTDYCVSPSFLMEYYCLSPINYGSRVGYQPHTCPNDDCEDGACQSGI